MNLAVSNIAWREEEELAVATKLADAGVTGVELALSKHWADPLTVSDDEARTYSQWWKDQGLRVVAFQSMLFQYPELAIIQSSPDRERALSILKRFIELAQVMGAKPLVFGSPKNRRREEKTTEEALQIVAPFFKEIGDYAFDHDVVFCLEPNAPQYNCDFVTTAQEAIDLIDAVSSPGFELHLDTACMALAGDDIKGAITKGKSHLKHFHISSPMLELVEDRPDVDHKAAAETLRAINYDGFVSMEMRPDQTGDNVTRVNEAVAFAKSIYA